MKKKNLFLIVLSILLLNFPARTQEEIYTLPHGRVSANSNPRAQEELKWWTVNNTTEEFVAKFPAKNFRMISLSGRSIVYRAHTNFSYFFIITSINKEDSPAKQLIDLAKAQAAEEFATTINKFKARRFSFIDSDSFYHEFITVKGEKKFYIFQAITCTKKYAPIQTFFTSLSFGGKHFEDQFLDNSVFDSYLKEESICSDQSFIADKQPEIMQKSDPDGEKEQKPLKFLKRPIARYTDLARTYRLGRSVELSATFDKNGTVKNIKVSKIIPFGVTKNVVDAVRGIKFNPAVKNGKRIDVTKKLAYMFSFY